MSTLSLAQRKEKIQRWAVIGLIVLAGLIVSPIIFLAIKGIVGLAIAAVLGLTITSFAPVISMKFANWRVKGIMQEAGENPIETMVNLLTEKRKAFETFHENVVAAVGARNSFHQKCQDFAKRWPARAPEFFKQLEAMNVLVERKKQALADAEQAIEAGEHKLDEMRAYWEMSKAAQAANEAAGMDTGDLYEKLKADTAVQAVFDSMNQAFAHVEVAAALDQNNITIQGVEYQPPADLNIVDMDINTPTRVREPVRQKG